MEYREYMEQQCVEANFHDQLLQLAAKAEKRSPKRYAGLAAAALVCAVGLGCWGLWYGDARQGTSDPMEEAQFPQLHYRSGSGGEMEGSIALPDGYFYKTMDEEEIASLWSADAQQVEEWGLFAQMEVSGQIIYDGQGQPWEVRITAENESDGTYFIMRLSPGQLPPECMLYENGDAADMVYGTAVTGWRWQTREEEDGAGRWNYQLHFLHEGEETVGVRMEMLGWDAAALEAQLARVVYYSLHADVLRLSQLATEEIPEWISEALDETALYAQEEFEAYLPTKLPKGYACTYGWRELGQGRDFVTAEWTRGDDYLSVSVEKDPAAVEGYIRDAVVNAADTRSYDVRRYGPGEPRPKGYFGSYDYPVFRAEEMSAAVVQLRLETVEENGDSAVFQADFQVLYEDGTLVRYLCRGMTAEEIWTMYTSASANAEAG